MCAAKVECVDGTTYVVGAGRQPQYIKPGADHLTAKDVNFLKVNPVYATSLGFDVIAAGEPEVDYRVTPTSVTTDPPGLQAELKLEKGNVLELPGGAKITPIIDAKSQSAPMKDIQLLA
jgi:hypothetical protein